MKSYIAAAAVLAVANAQSITDAPACVQQCVTQMLGLATQLGCSSNTDVVCLCANENFGFGVRDCSNAVCTNAADVQTGLQLLQSGYCAPAASSASAAGSSVSSLSAVGSSVLGGASSVPISTEGSYTTFETAGSTITSLLSATNTLYGFVTIGTDSAGSAFTSTITGAAAGFVTTGTNSDGSTYTSTLTGDAASSAESAAAAASSSASEGGSSASESISSVASDASASLSSVVASASSEASSRVSSASGAAGSATSTSSGGGAAPMITMAANGVVGLAGLAAVMLL